MQDVDVLIVEDEEPIREFVRINLERAGFAVREAADGESALTMVQAGEPRLVLLDLRLPGVDGLEVCRRLRDHHPQVAIIMLTARSQDMDRVLGLEMGADDYIVKPFNPLEMVARVRAVLRRLTVQQSQNPKRLQYDTLEIDLTARLVRKNGVSVELTPKEYELLVCLAGQPGRALSRDELLDAVWGTGFVGDPKTVDVHIRRLRAKIEEDSAKPRWLETVWGVGYRWATEK